MSNLLEKLKPSRLKRELVPFLIISVITISSFIFFSYPYLRWFQIIVIYGILKEKDFYEYNLNFKNFRMKLAINNQTITFALSFVAVFLAYLFILYIH